MTHGDLVVPQMIEVAGNAALILFIFSNLNHSKVFLFAVYELDCANSIQFNLVGPCHKAALQPDCMWRKP